MKLRKLTLSAWGQEVLLASHELLRGLLRRLRHVLLTEGCERLSACRRGKLLASDVNQLLILPLTKKLSAPCADVRWDCAELLASDVNQLLILTLPEQSLTDLTNAEVRLSAQVLACNASKALVCGLAKVLLAKAEQTLRCTLQRRELLLRHLGLRQTLTCQTQEAVLHTPELWV